MDGNDLDFVLKQQKYLPEREVKNFDKRTGKKRLSLYLGSGGCIANNECPQIPQ